MKRLHWTILGMAALSATGLVLRSIASVPPSSDTSAAQRSTHADSSLSTAGTYGAAEYRANVAIAKSQIENQNPLRSYESLSGLAGRIALDEIYAKGVPATPQSAALARALLNSGHLSRDEKIPLIRILASLYNRENTSGANSDIAQDLKILATDSDREIAHNATLYYSRLDYLPETESVLKKAFQSGAFSADDYYGELAHLIPSAPPEKQKEFLAKIRASSNSFATEVLTMALNSGQDFNAAPFLKASEDMAMLLRAHEPQFSSGVGEFGLGQAVAYTEWVRASAAIESQKSGRSVDDIIVAKLSEPGTDPRKVMGYLASPQAAPLLASAGPDSPVQKLVYTAQFHANQNPDNPNMSALMQEINGRMKIPPPTTPKPVFTPPAGPVAPPAQSSYAPQTMPRQHQ